MKQHNLPQGSPEWHAHRATHFNASDAPAMLGCSPYKTRTQLLHELKTGLAAEVDAATQRRFDDGHRFEALARSLAEEIIGQDLFPVVGTEGQFSASFDGITLLEDTVFEHKTLNADLRACMKDQGNGYSLPKHYQVQMEQQLLVSGADRVLFMASEWDGDTLVEERHCWYASDPALRAEILAGWAQFESDLETYQPAPTADPVPTGRAPESLPALRIEVTGMVTASNLDAFKAHALSVFGDINTNLRTDNDFADAEKTVKWCGDVEERLAAAKQHALSQTESIDALFRAIDEISAEARRVRLDLDKKVKAKKEERRGEIVAGGITALREHIAALNTRLGKPYMPQVPADFAGAIKGKKSLASMEDAVATELARAKIAANEIADRLQINLTYLREHAAEHRALFPDTNTIVHKAPDDLQALVTARIAEHKAAEERRLEAERERIRAEEAAKLAREQETKAAEERRQAEARAAEERRQAVAAEAAQRQELQAATTPADPPAPAPAPTVIPMPRQAAQASAPTLRLGQIGERLGFALTAEFVSRLGIEGTRERNSVLYHEADFHRIGVLLIAHVQGVLRRDAASMKERA